MAYLTHFVYLKVGTLWQLTAAPIIDTWIKKVSCNYISRQNWLQGKKWIWTIIQGHPGKTKLLFPQESVHVLNKPYRTDGETSRRSPHYSSMNTPVLNTTQVQATIELQQFLHLHCQAGLPPKNPELLVTYLISKTCYSVIML